MEIILNTINNRDLAAIIWILIVLLLSFLKRSIREPVFALLKGFFIRQLLTAALLIVFYISVIISVSVKLNLCTLAQFKVIFLWSICALFLTMSNAIKATEEEDFFKKTFIGHLKIVIAVEFIVNLYVFNLAIELIIIPLITTLAMLSVYAETDSQYAEVKKVTDFTLSLLGFGFIGYASYQLYTDFHNFSRIDNFRNLLIPPIFSISLFPLVYMMALSVAYESLFTRMPFFIKEKNLLRFTKRKVIQTFHFKRNSLKRWSKKFSGFHITTKDDVLNALKKAT